MLRRAALTAVLVTCSLIAWADAPATFVLNSGETLSGTLIYGRGDNNIVDGRFHLLVRGQDQSFPLSEVVAVDFIGGNPSSEELNALPSDSGVMVMRDGRQVRGHLTNIVTDDQVQWVNEAGNRQNYPISDVSRLYLNVPTARLAYRSNADAATPVGTSGQAVPGAIRVNANQPWTDTGMTVRKGDRVSFSGSGLISVASGVTAPLDGTTAVHGSYPVPRAAAGALIFRVGNGAAFPIGSNTQAITMPADGRLSLGVNDDYFADNTGYFTVTVTKQ